MAPGRRVEQAGERDVGDLKTVRYPGGVEAEPRSWFPGGRHVWLGHELIVAQEGGSSLVPHAQFRRGGLWFH
ncbi:hypothetical protein GCM10009837_44880 [Streptomyces durmitorensis]